MVESRQKNKKLVSMAMLCALAYLVMLVGRIPIVLFLKYDPKDIVIAIGGFLYGPVSAFVISVVVALVELPISETGIIGCIMNLVSSAAFACTAAYFYSRKRTLNGPVAGGRRCCHGVRDAAVELFSHAHLHGLSARRGGRHAAARVFAL